MGNGQVGFRNADVSVQQQIAVHGPGAIWPGRIAHPAKQGLVGQKRLQQPSGRPGIAQGKGHDLIEKRRLIGCAPGLGLVDGACARQKGVRERAEALPGQTKIGQPVALVGAQADIGGYSLAMRDNASSMRATGTVMAMRK